MAASHLCPKRGNVKDEGLGLRVEVVTKRTGNYTCNELQGTWTKKIEPYGKP